MTEWEYIYFIKVEDDARMDDDTCKRKRMIIDGHTEPIHTKHHRLLLLLLLALWHT